LTTYELGYVAKSPFEHRALGAHIAGIAFDAAGTAAFGVADGTVHLVDHALRDWRLVQLVDGAVLSLARDAAPTGFIVGDDGGAFSRIAADGVTSKLAEWPGKWVDHVASCGNAADSLLACSVGKKLHLFDRAATPVKVLDHPSTVSGFAFDSKGKRVAASHYNGASLWFTASKTDNPRRLVWKGSHITIALHPAGEAVVTAMQENALHGWRLTDGQHMRMSGYPAKTESLSFTRSGRWLASSGADAIVLWPFFGSGPMGRPPTELAQRPDILCTRVACHPQHELCAAGFADGAVVLADIAAQRLLPVVAPGDGAVSALTWNLAGSVLAFGTETGFAGLVDMSVR
jgi:WD40 repeat protein